MSWARALPLPFVLAAAVAEERRKSVGESETDCVSCGRRRDVTDDLSYTWKRSHRLQVNSNEVEPGTDAKRRERT